MVLAPLVWGRKGEHKQVFNEVRRDGYVRVKVDGKIRTLDEDITLVRKRNIIFLSLSTVSSVGQPLPGACPNPWKRL